MSSPQSDTTQGRRPLPKGSLRLGTIAGIDITVTNTWFLMIALIALIMAEPIQTVAPDIGALAYVAGAAYALLLYFSVLLHEASHAIAALSFGRKVISINLLFLGGVTEIEGESETPWREFVIAVVGPLTSLAVGGVAFAVGTGLESDLMRLSILTLAFGNLLVGALNLVPGLPLDGGYVLQSFVWAVTGRRSLATTVAAWGGRVAAVAVLGYPLLLLPALGYDRSIFDYLIAIMISAFLWTGASQALAMSKVRSKLPALQARRLARSAIGVPPDLPLAEAIRRAQEAHAGSVVVVAGDGQPTGIVNEAAVVSTPADRRPWLPVGDLARRLEDGLSLSADLTGESLLRAMNKTPATEYVLVEADGSVFGVLVTKDVDAAFRVA